MSVNQSKKRLSVSPIISTFSFYNKLSLNSPLVANNNSNQVTTTTTTSMSGTTTTTVNPSSTTTSTVISAHQHYMQRNFSPMATLSRSPNCSSSPAVMTSMRRTINSAISNTIGTTNQLSSLNSNSTLLSSRNSLQINSATTTNLQVTNANSNSTFMTPLIEVNSHPYMGHQFKTPSSTNLNSQHTPMNNFRRIFTPQLNNSSINTIGTMESSIEGSYESYTPEYCLELVWTEPVMVAGDSTFNERATKFFYINDLYNQKYVCYLMPTKTQLRCLKIEQNLDLDMATPVGLINYIPAKDAVYVETRGLMVVIDNLGSLFVYSGLTKLCKLQLHNIIWSSLSNPFTQQFSKFNDLQFQSPIVTPIKSKLFGPNSNPIINTDIHIDESIIQGQQLFKTPKQGSNQLPIPSSVPILQQQHEFKSVSDSTGSRFNVRLNDNRLIRVNLQQSSTCKMVNLCLEGFKYSLSKEIYYEIIQQWYIHRYAIGGESLKDQLNLFLYLILNLCGCFDMTRLEQDMPFLATNNFTKLKPQPDIPPTKQQHFENIDDSLLDTSVSMGINNLDSSVNNPVSNANAKRAKCNYEGNDDDWEFLLNDDLVYNAFNNSEKNLNEFSELFSQRKSKQINSKGTKTEANRNFLNTNQANESMNQNENIKSSQPLRQKRPINSVSTGTGQKNESNSSGQNTGEFYSLT